MPIKPFDPNKTAPSDNIYLDDNGVIWQAIGWITNPAVILQNVQTGEQHVEVIGCLNAERFTPMEPVKARG